MASFRWKMTLGNTVEHLHKKSLKSIKCQRTQASLQISLHPRKKTANVIKHAELATNILTSTITQERVVLLQKSSTLFEQSAFALFRFAPRTASTLPVFDPPSELPRRVRRRCRTEYYLPAQPPKKKRKKKKRGNGKPPTGITLPPTYNNKVTP